jgi:hypothetical protein
LSVATEKTSISADIINGTWTKAAELIVTNGAIAKAPGCSLLARNLKSTSKPGFHKVKPGKKNRFIK